jgi:hypothetical protein
VKSADSLVLYSGVNISMGSHSLLEFFGGSVEGSYDGRLELDVDSSGVRLDLVFFSSSDDHTGDSFLVERPGISDISHCMTSIFGDLFAVRNSFPQEVLESFFSMSTLRARLAVEMAGSATELRNVRGLRPSAG